MQSQEPEAALQAVSFKMRDSGGTMVDLVIQAGPSHFGLNLKNGQKVSGRAVLVEPIKACEEPENVDQIKGNIAVMERGSCMFVDKARRIQKVGAIGAIILDNTPGTNSATSPLFSMSGDGIYDIKIPAVFLFTQDASKLRLALSRDPETEFTIGELKKEGAGWPREEESVFYKLKMSVQEFLNKHTGIGSSDTIAVGDFKAVVGTDKLQITYEKGGPNAVFVEQSTNQQWSQIRRGLIKSIISSESKELYVPLSILAIYYQTLSGASPEEVKTNGIIKQTDWLLQQLNIEHRKKNDDHLVDVLEPKGQQIESESLDNSLIDTKSNIEHLSTLLASISEIEQNVIDDFKKGGDDLVIIGGSINKGKVILTTQQLEATEVKKSKNQKNLKEKHVPDEL